MVVDSTSGLGSSPRMRGALVDEVVVTVADGIIPAYAGSTAMCFVLCGGTWDHPRVCGEHFKGKSGKEFDAGSSPRMRGARQDAQEAGEGRGIIPAYAGSTGVEPFENVAVGDHPRVCGEHVSSMRVSTPDRGSSPRMRGAPAADHSEPVRSGIIPAYAGSTWTG